MKDKIFLNIATVLSIIGSICVASHIGYEQLGFILYLIGSIFWVAYGIAVKNKQIMIMNIVFLFINILGIIRF